MDTDQSNSNEVSDVVSQLVEQLKNTATHLDKRQKDSITPARLSSEELEILLVDASSKLVKGSVETVEELKQLVLTAPNAQDVRALSELIASSASAIESLGKVFSINRRIEAAKELKQMDIDSKKQLQETDIKGKLLMNREDLLKQLMDNATAIEINSTPQKLTSDL